MRPDVTDAVLAERSASFEAPVEQDPFVIDATSRSDPATIATTAEAIAAATVR